MRTLVPILALVLAAAPARAECLPTVLLDGDALLVAQLGAELVDRGIAIAGSCPARTARVERRGDALVVSISDTARTVSEIKTAAAVIESFVRDDVGSPLLAVRPLGRPRSIHAPATPRLPRGWHFFGGLEGAVASDQTRWMGMQLGACRMVGVLCAAARLRGGEVVNDEGVWASSERRAGEVLLGFDIPFRINTFLVSPGVALGFGDITTRSGEAPSHSSNFRGQAHVTLSVPISHSFAIDISAAGTLAQQVEREAGYMTTLDEPLGYVRLGVGVRYGTR